MFDFHYLVGVLNNKEYSILWSTLGSIGQWFGVVATFIVAFIALQTAKDAKRTYMIDQRPYVAFDGIEPFILKKGDSGNILMPTGQQTKKGQEGIQIGIVLRNVGKTIANYRVIKFQVNVKDKTKTNPDFNTAGGVVYPGMVTIYRFPFIECPIGAHENGVIEYIIEYSKDWNDTVYISERKIAFDIFLLPSLQIRWVFLSEVEGTKARSFLRRISDIFGI